MRALLPEDLRLRQRWRIRARLPPWHVRPSQPHHRYPDRIS